MKKIFLSGILTVCLIMLNIPVHAAVMKDETVYVNLNNDGSVNNIKVVNHAYENDSLEEYIDYGLYNNLKNLVGDVKPKISENQITWSKNAFKNGELYYEGDIDKDLPIGIAIKYFLDGQEMKAEELRGKDGHLKIDFNVNFNPKNEKVKPNLMAQIGVELDLDTFKNIKSEGNKVVVGKKSTINFIALPPKEQKFTLEMDGKNIGLAPITITLLPAKFSVPQDIRDSVDKLTMGLETMDKGSQGLEKGMSNMIDGTSRFKGGMVELNQGIGNINIASKSIYDNSGKIVSGMEEFSEGLGALTKESNTMIQGLNGLYNGFDQLSTKGKDIYEGLGSLYDGTKSISNGISGLSIGMQQLEGNHQKLVQLAMLMKDSSDPMVKAMAQGIIEEAQAMNALKEGMEGTKAGMENAEKNLKLLYQGYGEYNKGMSSAKEGMKSFIDQSSSFPQGIEKFYNNFEYLKESSLKLRDGYGEINKGLNSINKETSSIDENIDKLISGQREVLKGIGDFNNNGIKKMKISIEKNINESFLGDKVSDSYTSFADNDKNKNSTVQFIMRTPAIENIEEKKEIKAEKQNNKSLLQRFLDLFR